MTITASTTANSPMPEFPVHTEGKISWQQFWTPEVAIAAKPDWLHTLEIEWSLEYDSSPSFRALTNSDPLHFTNDDAAVWELKEGRRWVAEHNGCLMQQFHGGRLSWDEERQAWVTTRQEGYGGREFMITMRPGSDPRFTVGRNKVILCGPWHGSPPKGYASISTKPRDSNNCYCFGLELHIVAIVQMFPLFFPDHTLNYVWQSYGRHGEYMMGPWVEPFKPGQEVPRTLISNRRCDRATQLQKWKNAKVIDAEELHYTVGRTYRGHDGVVYYIDQETRNGLDIICLSKLDVEATRRSISVSAIDKTFQLTRNRV
jgi:hypothetical protein